MKTGQFVQFLQVGIAIDDPLHRLRMVKSRQKKLVIVHLPGVVLLIPFVI